MTFLTVSTYQIALTAILPKADAGMTDEALAAATNFPLDLVRRELLAMVQAGEAILDVNTGRYSAAGEQHG
jgi:hypothetical protein